MESSSSPFKSVGRAAPVLRPSPAFSRVSRKTLRLVLIPESQRRQSAYRVAAQGNISTVREFRSSNGSAQGEHPSCTAPARRLLTMRLPNKRPTILDIVAARSGIRDGESSKGIQRVNRRKRKVTRPADGARGKRKKKRGFSPKACRQQCSTCGLVQVIDRGALYRAARPRCSFCGGPLNWFREA